MDTKTKRKSVRKGAFALNKYFNIDMDNCQYCGNNPINHQAVRFNSSLEIVLFPMRQKLFYGWFGKNVINSLVKAMGWAIFYSLKTMGLIWFNPDAEKIPFNRGKTLIREAERRGMEVYEIKPFNLSVDCYWAKIGNKSKVFFGLPRPDNVDESILAWIDDKWIMKQKLINAGLPVPPGGSFSSVKPAIEFFKTLGKPVVVKPRLGSRNRHTSVLVQTEKHLREAFKIAKQLCFYVLVEEYLYGDVLRATFIGGSLAGIMGISPAKVTGDGSSPIARLIEIHNHNLPHPAMKPVTISPAHIKHLMLQNLSVDSILPADQTVPLLEKMGDNYGGTSYDCTNETHPQIKEILKKAAQAVGDPILGFDFIAEDVTKPISAQNLGIIECNANPFINLHHDPMIGKPRNIAALVWDLIT